MPRVFHAVVSRCLAAVCPVKAAAGELGWELQAPPGPGRAARAEGAFMTEPQDVPRRRAFACDATVLGRPVRVLFGAGTLAQWRRRPARSAAGCSWWRAATRTMPPTGSAPTWAVTWW